jgi:hypothetical protein
MVLDKKILGKKLLENDFEEKIHGGISTCLEIGLTILKSNKAILEFEDVWFDRFSETLVDIWLPNPRDDEKQKKIQVKKHLPAALKMLKKNYSEIFSAKEDVIRLSPKYENAKAMFIKWDTSVNETKVDYEQDAIRLANPFLTISVEETVSKGIELQKHAKIASSLETKWGSWGEEALALFNKKLIVVHAGRIDYRLGSVLYDVKSGPNVLNLRDLDGARLKRGKIQALSKEKTYGHLIGIDDFAIGIIYGREELATKSWMRNTGGLIIFGNKTWKTLTGNSWNAFKFFVWHLRYMNEKSKQKSNPAELAHAVKMFVDSFYGDDESILNKALSDPEFKKIKGSS